MNYIAHIRNEENGTQYIQTATDHSRKTAEYAGICLEKIELFYPAYLAGLLHDMGKFKQEFQRYILKGEGERGSVIHTFAGARYILETYRKQHQCDAKDITAEIIAYAVAAHHGLFDIENGISENGFQHRIDNNSCNYEESRDAFFAVCAREEEIDILMSKASEQIDAAINKMFSMDEINARETTDDEIAFYMGLLSRMILSAVIDGDRTDTAEFMSDTICRFPNSQTDWKECLSRVEEKIDSFPASKEIEIARRRISNQCRSKAEESGGIMQLNVPTGGGKTLSSLRYALAHAAKWNKSRIIFTAPLLTILEQNAAVLRDFIQDDSIILEHHSNVVNSNELPEYMAMQEAFTESWNAPIIITTLVQLLNTMFSGKTSSIRRFHSLADSVIIIDEVQTVPTKILSLFNLALNFLSGVCGATIVLCSATQPCLETIEHSIAFAPQNIVPYDPESWKVFMRTELRDGGACRLDEVPEFAKDLLNQTDSLLIVCNKKTEAVQLFEMMKGEGNCFHLSASMCAEHRRMVLKDVYDSLALKERKTICISTQVIEAGVDISFGAVIRLAAGMDSVIQSAGRCNRNAESKTLAPVYILRIVDENLEMLEEIKRGKDSTVELLDIFSKDSELFGNDLASYAAINFYYEKLYGKLVSKATEYPIDGDTIYNLLSSNVNHCKADSPYYYQQAFKTGGNAFKVFDDNSIDVIVPYGEGAEILSAMHSERAANDFNYMRELIRKAKNYTVPVYDYQRKKLESNGGMYWLNSGMIAVLEEDFYDEDTGLRIERKSMNYLEV